MSSAVRVALTGFTSFERDTFDTFFRLTAQRSPCYVLAHSMAESDVAIANADDPVSVAEVLEHGSLTRTLMLGATPHRGAAQQLPRPLNLMLVMRALNVVVAKAKQRSPAVQRVLDDLASITTNLTGEVDPRRLAAAAAAGVDLELPGVEVETAPEPEPQAPPPPAPSLLLQRHTPMVPRPRRTLDHILLVDSNDIALRFMTAHLEHFGFQVHLARSGVEAIERVTQRHFEFVFIEAALEGLDGFHTCKAIKRATYADDRPAPTVVMLTRRDVPVDTLRCGLAGSDAYLGKPLREEDLLKIVGDREVTLHAYAETADAARTRI